MKLADGEDYWYMSSKSYCEAAVKNIESGWKRRERDCTPRLHVFSLLVGSLNWMSLQNSELKTLGSTNSRLEF